MNIVVNGESKQVSDGLTISGLLGLLMLDPQRVAVERNRKVIPREEFSATELVEDDRLEIVQFVGGG